MNPMNTATHQKFFTSIHTMQIEQDINKIKNPDGSTNAKLLRITGENKALYKINVNPKPTSGLAVKTMSEHKRNMDLMYSELGIEVTENLKFNRLDIAIDSELDLNENLKYFCYVFELLTYSDRYANNIEIIDRKSIEYNALSSRHKGFELIVYDKAKESNNNSDFNTRMEFRYKRIESSDYSLHFKKLINRIKAMDSNIDSFNAVCIKRICDTYDRELTQNRVLSLSAFVGMYDRYIFTYEILAGLYSHAKLKTPLKQWLNDIRKSRNIEYFNKTVIKQFKAKIMRSIKIFQNN
jgi:hypothetical protein